MSPHTPSPTNAIMSCLPAIASCRYGLVRKKSRLSAEHKAVATAARRPPYSATTIVKAMNAKPKFEAEVRLRSGTSASPKSKAARVRHLKLLAFVPVFSHLAALMLKDALPFPNCS